MMSAFFLSLPFNYKKKKKNIKKKIVKTNVTILSVLMRHKLSKWPYAEFKFPAIFVLCYDLIPRDSVEGI